MPRCPLPSTLALLACSLLLLAPGVQAGGGHDDHRPAKPGKPAASASKVAEDPIIEEPAASAPAATPAPRGMPKPIMTMDDLRQRLQDKMAQVRPAQPAAEASAPEPAAPPARAPAAAAVGSAQDLILRVPAAPARAPARAVAAHGAGHKANSHGAAAHWGYDGDGAPAAWGSLKPEFATCANGTRQSPIDIRGGIRVDLEPIQFDYRPVSFQVVDNGHTVQVNLAPGNSIVVSGRRYELLQFHFHRPSEEAINGRRFEMVAHLVHKDAEGRLAVVAVLLDQGKAHPMVQLVWNSLPLEQAETVQSPVPIDMNLMLPDDRRYYTYMGSLTTPPCSEGVRWMVLKQPA
ncbi:MAG TPA: carbonic anhydrase family protein, partial [Burkholderiaceae bacterium]|nr:carbonic anhydrase family protein [Burkholderiaceae bacterium]